MLSYIFVYSVNSVNAHKEIVKMTQEDLQGATDGLTTYLEQEMKNELPLNFIQEVKYKSK